MSEPFIAEIRIFALNFAPRNWAQCNGQLLPIAQNTALFSLVGTYYGGNGIQTFGLPDLQGNVPIGVGQGAGLSTRSLGEMGGASSVTLTTSEIPAHSHTLQASSDTASTRSPEGNVFAIESENMALPYTASSSGPNTDLTPAIAGNSYPHENMQPYLVLNYCIALQGIYPSRP